MSLAILVDMNLSPDWVPVLTAAGWSAVHWSTVGDRAADDATLMAWALANKQVVFTHDLDFGTTLARLTRPGRASCRSGDRRSCRKTSRPRYSPPSLAAKPICRRGPWSPSISPVLACESYRCDTAGA